MTWGELKRLVEALPEVTDETEIDYFDFSGWMDVRAHVSKEDGQLAVFN